MNTTSGAVIGNVRTFLRIEGLAFFCAALLLYKRADYPWILFVLLFLAPDLSLLGYLAGSRVGAIIYNLVHTYAAPVLLGVALLLTGQPVTVAIIWAAHVGFDRFVGYGLKYPDAFSHTHLGPIGRKQTKRFPPRRVTPENTTPAV